MSIGSGDISHLESAAASSSGGAITATPIITGVKNNLFPDITDGERVAGGTRYRKSFWKNSHATDAAAKPCLYIPVLPTNATLNLGLGIDSADDADAAQGNMTAWGANAQVALISDGTDTRTATIYGMNNAGTPVAISEAVVLTSAVEVLSVATFSKVWAVFLASTSGTRIVTVKQGAGGTTRGTIGISKKGCWLWVLAGAAVANGITLPDLAAGQNYGCWHKLSWSAGASVTKPGGQTIAFRETA